MEDPRNIMFTCKECAEKMYQDKGNFDVNVGDFVKLKFTDSFGTEYMWVEVVKIDMENNKYDGCIDNDPVIVQHVACGDNILFIKEEILQVIKKARR